ncbi:Exodeoxyribonuclease V alpha chain [Moritella sp. JT01]|uniref:exodeoxyribonuclease V subunit alpha n=1 Tax=Moritella sp. JT01 TaxID=756698 RepID=UPI00079B13B7|nr:exodeoxyribonuclease V subunit alpha [Moritella sp. JT01]KXO08710.1 Exodeoxyribonuclease V alpha chain [Moritella sp. JT01]
MSVLHCLKELANENKIRQLDYQFARFISNYESDPAIILLACLTSYQLGKGHVCIDLKNIDSNALFDLNLTRSHLLLAEVPSRSTTWPTLLANSVVVGESAPLQFVNDANKLYLQRYWAYELQVAQQLKDLAKQSQQPDLSASLNRLFKRDYGFLFPILAKEREANFSAQAFVAKYLDVVKKGRISWQDVEQVLLTAKNAQELHALDSLIPEAYCLNWQKLSVAVAATRHFSVISGGPGTGKTTTVTKLLALLIEQGLLAQQALTIKLVAPTGKAAARLTESIAGAKGKLDLHVSVADLIPEQAGTIHRLLGVIPNRQAFRHNKDNPLHLDVLVVDEASMVDLPLMAKLLAALPPHARLILLGDKDQLASVEAGSVLADICAYAESGYSAEQANWLSKITDYELSQYQASDATAIYDSLCLLRKSYRFDAESGIGCLAGAVNRGDLNEFDRVWENQHDDIHLHPLSTETYDGLITMAKQGYQDYLAKVVVSPSEDEAKSILRSFNDFQILTAIREGDFGVHGLNQRIEKALQSARKIRKNKSEWYAGRPIMITNNDHGLGLYNGDIGICMQDDDDRMRVYFEMADGNVQSFLPSRLPPHQTVFAMTIHKSQGSEFRHTVMILPNRFNPVLTRELVYTGITRAKEKLDIFTNVTVLKKAIKLRTERVSGLMALLNQD